jgi:hypothetical protein
VSWIGIFRLALVQMALGAMVVLTTSTLNRLMAVELMLPALVPGLLVGLHHAVPMTRPRMGFGSDMGGRRTPWIAGGMAVLALGGFLAAVATAWMSTDRLAGLGLAVLGYTLVGLGVSAAGTSLLVLLAKQVEQERRAAAATLVWVLMIVGFAVTAGLAGRWLDPYSPARLVLVSGTVSLVALCVAWSAGVVAVHKYVQPVGMPSLLHTLMGVAMGMLLVFRTSSSYDRFWEGRKLWGGIVNETRNLIRGAAVHLKDDPALLARLTRWTAAYAWAAMHSLRGTDGLGPQAHELAPAEVKARREPRGRR